MNLWIHRGPPERVAAWLRAAGVTIEAQLLFGPEDPTAAIVFARRPDVRPAGSA